MNSNDEIIRYLTKLKDEQKLSISEIARRTGMAKSAVSRYFNKTREFPVNKVDLFASALHTTSEKILGIKKTPTSVDNAIDNMQSYQGRPIPEDQKEIIRDLVKGYLDRNMNK